MRLRGKHADSPAPRNTFRPRLIPAEHLWKRGIGTAAAAVILSTALVAQGGITTDASWNDTEWANGDVGTLNCNAPATLPLHTTGEGRMLSGSLLGIGTDTLAGVPGVTVENNEGNITHSPNALPVDGQTAAAYADPLQVSALDNLLGVNLSHLIQLPLETGLGVYGQFGQATRDRAAGASGTLTNSGGINTTGETAGKPDGLANINLLGLLSLVDENLAQSFTQDGLSVGLDVGAVAAQSKLDACDLMWQHAPQAAVQRDYLAAGADLVIKSPLVGQLVSEVSSTVEGVQNAVTDLTNGTLKLLLKGVITDLVGGLLSNGLGIGNVEVTNATVEIQLDVVRKLLTGTISDPSGILSIALTNDQKQGEIRIDTAALLAKAYANDPTYPVDKLNGLPPNTNILADPRVLTTLNTALGEALNNWVGTINSLLDSAVNTIQVDIQARVSLKLLVEVATIAIGVSGGLNNLQATAPVTILGLQLPIISNILNGLTSLITAGIVPLVRDLILNTTGIVRSLPQSATDLVNNLLGAVLNLSSSLFLSKLVQVHINAQNLPQEGTNDVPHDLQALGASNPNRFDVAAIRISVLSVLGDKEIRLYLARASAEGALATP